jgi:hypothetical protein
MEVTLTPGKTINIPAYWWYSIEFEKDSSIACFRYITYMNNAAIVPHIALHALQLQNVKRDVAKKHDIKELNKGATPNTSSLAQDPLEEKKVEKVQSEPVINDPMDEIQAANFDNTTSINTSAL